MGVKRPPRIEAEDDSAVRLGDEEISRGGIKRQAGRLVQASGNDLDGGMRLDAMVRRDSRRSRDKEPEEQRQTQGS